MHTYRISLIIPILEQFSGGALLHVYESWRRQQRCHKKVDERAERKKNNRREIKSGPGLTKRLLACIVNFGSSVYVVCYFSLRPMFVLLVCIREALSPISLINAEPKSKHMTTFFSPSLPKPSLSPHTTFLSVGFCYSSDKDTGCSAGYCYPLREHYVEGLVGLKTANQSRP